MAHALQLHTNVLLDLVAPSGARAGGPVLDLLTACHAAHAEVVPLTGCSVGRAVFGHRTANSNAPIGMSGHWTTELLLACNASGAFQVSTRLSPLPMLECERGRRPQLIMALWAERFRGAGAPVWN
jgi:hypothetical protein